MAYDVKRIWGVDRGEMKPQSGAPMNFQQYRQKQSGITSKDKTALPILAHPQCERELVTHIIDRVKMADEERKRRATRAQKIDIQLSGYITLSDEDKKRKQDNEAGKPPKPTKHNLPLAQAQMDECATYLMSVFAPEMDFFEAVAPADKQDMAQAVVAEINRHSQKGQYYRHLVKGCSNMIKYNFGGWTIFWEKESGVVFKGNAGGIAEKKQGTVFEGNTLDSIDVYNFFYDTTVHPVDLPKQGEFYAQVCRKTPFRIKKDQMDGKLFAIDRYVNEVFGDGTSAAGQAEGNSFYIRPPSVRDEQSVSDSGAINWVSLFSGTAVQDSSPGCELITYVGWIDAKKFKLADKEGLQLWRVVVANGQFITAAFKIDDSHGMLPCAIGAPLEDDLKNEQRTYAEQLIPLQHFASFLLNSHQEAVRKAIYGITVYLAQYFPGLDLTQDDLIGGMFAAKSSAGDLDIDKIFRHYNAAPETDQNVAMISQLDAIMQKILPTDLVRNVADLERATLYQAAATVQAGNRRQLKLARMISDQALNGLKFIMIYNLYSNMQSISFIGPDGARTTVSMGDVALAGIEYEIGTGLKGMDRLMTIQILRDIITSLLQSQQGMAEIDIVALLDYFMSLAGDRTDLKQFRRKTPMIDPATGQPTQPAAGNAPTGNNPDALIVPGSESRK